ncbi:MAG: hypothetical protein U9N76_04970 [Candidatus Marinimicrobia bacterium]|nr:hypothetical protein [Candidatus Neomarinimicrobiota bacterium]
MKKIILLIALGVVFVSCNIFNLDNTDNENGIDTTNVDTIDYDSIELSDSVLYNYYDDAMELYFREIKSDSTHPNFNNPIFDTTEIEKKLKIIQAVYDSDSPQRNIVFETYDIHASTSLDFKSILASVDTGATEIKNLINGNIPTGNDDLDSILIEFHFDSIYAFHIIPSIVLYSSEKYNMLPIIEQLENIPSIIYAEPNYYNGDGNNITLNSDANSPKITFSHGYGDCPSGCINRDYWEFQIIGSEAEFIRKY